ncbi:MAG: tetratricopeptide repeat protein [Pseudomonadota bacterium]
METALFNVFGHPVSLGEVLGCGGATLVALILGWLGGRSSVRSGVRTAKATPRSPSDDAFLKGVSHLMADHTDQAIEEFTRAVTLNSETVETYVVLGNLFRQKGEIERAVRIRQSIIARPHLAPPVRLQALYDLGLDYRKGGLFNRAVDSFQEVLTMDAGHVEACRQLVNLFEEMRDWEKAFEALKRLGKLTGYDNHAILAHYKTEQGKEFMSAGHLEKAEEALEQALRVDKGCLDAYLHLGDLELTRGRLRKALGIWRRAVKLAPDHAHLVVNRLAQAEEALGVKTVQTFFDEIETDQADVHTLQALAESYNRLGNPVRALELLNLAVERAPHQLGVHRLRGQVLLAQGQSEPALAAYRELLAQINGNWDAYQCGQCGFISHQLTWKCPRCHAWDTIAPYRPAA